MVVVVVVVLNNVHEAFKVKTLKLEARLGH